MVQPARVVPLDTTKFGEREPPAKRPLGMGAEVRSFKLPCDLPPAVSRMCVRTIEPDSGEWNSLGMDRRLGVSPFLGKLVRDGKAKVVFTERYTSTCKEKAEAAGIPVENTIKALFCKDIFTEERYLLVVSGKGAVITTTALSSVDSLEFTPQLEVCAPCELPDGMEMGTCSAFVSQQVLGEITLVAVEDPRMRITGKKGRQIGPELGARECDFSIGGTDQAAHHLSVRMNYAEFLDAVLEEYGEKAVVVSGLRRS